MKLTNPKNWDTFAGGTCAADEKNSYSKEIKGIGKYYITPVSHHHNYNHHLGYSVQVANIFNRFEGGMWRFLSLNDGESQCRSILVNLRTARRICENHRTKYSVVG